MESTKDLQKESAANGNDKITMDEIDAIIAKFRREKRGNAQYE